MTVYAYVILLDSVKIFSIKFVSFGIPSINVPQEPAG